MNEMMKTAAICGGAVVLAGFGPLGCLWMFAGRRRQPMVGRRPSTGGSMPRTCDVRRVEKLSRSISLILRMLYFMVLASRNVR